MYDITTQRHTPDSRLAPLVDDPGQAPQITIRVARDADLPSIARVEGRDARRLADGPLLIATVDGEVRAAISLADGTVAADPFHRTAELVAMLRIRADAAGGAHGTGRTRVGRSRRGGSARHPRGLTHAVGG